MGPRNYNFMDVLCYAYFYALPCGPAQPDTHIYVTVHQTGSAIVSPHHAPRSGPARRAGS